MRGLLCCWVHLVGCTLLCAQDQATPGSMKLVFANKTQAAQLLSQEDEFVKRLSPFDRAGRLKTNQAVDRATYLKFVSEQALDWDESDKEKINAAWQRVSAKLSDAKFQAPAQVMMIQTTGKEEGDAAYTRGTAIILPKSKAGGRSLDALLAHELFHVLSRNNAVLREELYELIGYRKCGELELPADMQARRLTNPDGPVNDHCIQITHDGKPVWVVPVLFSKTDKYDESRGGEFLSYLQFTLMAIESPDMPSSSRPMMVDGKPLTIDVRDAQGFLDKIGRNTGYIIHPDEVLADNFSMWVTQRKVPQPELLEKIEKVLRKQ